MEQRFDGTALFEAGERAAALRPLVAAGLARRAGLQLALDDAGATLRLPPPGETPVVLSGWWRSPLLAGDWSGPPALVVAPFLFAIDGLQFPPGSLASFAGSGSAADFLMHNLLLAALRGHAFRFVERPRTGPERAASLALRLSYLASARRYFSDELLRGPDACELLLAHAHVPLALAASPLLATGAEAFRRQVALVAGRSPAGAGR